MISEWLNFLRRKRRNHGSGELDPDQIFLDSSNLPSFDTNQFEGRLEQPISKRVILFIASILFLIMFVFLGRAWYLEVVQGGSFLEQSENNHLRHTLIFAKRGSILDRNGKELAWNAPLPDFDEFLGRVYSPLLGLSHVLGYVKYPSKDSSGFYYKNIFEGHDGVEKYYDDILSGKNGIKIIETDALGRIKSQSTIRPPEEGRDLKLTIDADVQSKFAEFIKQVAAEQNYTGGAGVIMDVHTGEILALTSFPEYDPQILTDGKDTKAIQKYLTSKTTPFLDRVVSGLYTPGSIMKPYISLGVLQENLISPSKQILSTGSISVQNPYDKTQKTIFKDWKAHGLVDMRRAIAVSSDVYFYEVGGGFENQKGLGISNIEKYTRMFGFGSALGEGFFQTKAGTIPNPEWKKINFDGDDWRLGDTYHTSIGQYGFQVTPIQAVRAVASVANDGHLLTPSLVPVSKPVSSEIQIKKEYFQLVREGMRLAVTEGTSTGLKLPYVEIATKSGTAEIGNVKQYINSWLTGFFPYQNPKYAFAVIMEQGPHANTVGSLYVMRQLFEWMHEHKPEYLQN